MSTETRPPLLQLGGREAFDAYEKEFGRLYQIRRVIDVLGNEVIFRRDACGHVCFKRDEEDRSVRRKRDIWSQERTEHIPWILPALTDASTEVRPNDKDPYKRCNYLLVAPADPENNLPQEYFVVIIEKINQRVVEFITAYPVDHKTWSEYRRAGLALYAPSKKRDR